MRFFIHLTWLTFFFTVSCKNEPAVVENDVETVVQDTIASAIKSDIDTNAKGAMERTENVKKIEQKYGFQWGFCECVVANDSVNEAIINTTDFESKSFDKLMLRSDEITKRCQAFLSLDESKTPEQRTKHEKKVKKCLKEAGRL